MAHPSLMIGYEETSIVRDARQRYFAANGFSDAGYDDAWIKFRFGPIPVAFPNTPTRRRAIPLHDLHHVATEYATTVIGEAEIAAWELAGGCTDHWAAWVLNAGAFAYGIVLSPRRVYRAFVRGRHSRTLYHEGFRDELLSLTVGELRRRLQLDHPPARATWRDRAAFAGWIAAVSSPVLTGCAGAIWALTRRS